MAIWNTLKGELDKAGRAAQSAIDEGKLRLEQHRAKQRAEAAAASLGYAVSFGIAVVITSLYPGITLLLARITLGERMRAVQRVGLVLAAAGVAMVTF